VIRAPLTCCKAGAGWWRSGGRGARQASKTHDFVNAIPGLRVVPWPTAIFTNGRSGAKPPTDLNMIEGKAMSFLGEGNLAGARELLHAPPQALEPNALLVSLRPISVSCGPSTSSSGRSFFGRRRAPSTTTEATGPAPSSTPTS
jgi:hypothetical protein